MVYTPPAPEISNYIGPLNNAYVDGCGNWGYVYVGFNGDKDKTAELLAWLCNQQDNCGAIHLDSNQLGGWLISTDGFGWFYPPAAPMTTYNAQIGRCHVRQGGNPKSVWFKKSLSFPKATVARTDIEGVVANPKTTVKLRSGGQVYASIYAGTGAQNAGQGGGCPGGCNRAQDVVAPLGWRWMISDNNIYGDGRNNWHSSYLQYSQTPNVPIHIADNAWNDDYIVANVGFDVAQNFDSMVSIGGVDTYDAIRIRNGWCAKKENIDGAVCKNWYDNGSIDGTKSSTTWAAMKLGVCSGIDWGNDATCVNMVNQILKNGAGDGNFSSAETMVQAYCQDTSKQACACVNAVGAGTIDACVATPNKPGCDTIAQKVGKYKTLGAQFLTASLKPFCACDQCQEASTSTTGRYISQPGPTGGCNDKINACFQQITVGQMTGGTLNSGCTIQDINPPPPAPAPSPASAPPTPASPAASAPAASAPAASAPAADADLLWSSTLIPGVDTKMKQIGAIIGLIGFIFCCCCCCILMMKGGGNSGSSSKEMMKIMMARLGR